MKWFTRAWQQGALSDDQSDAVVADYAAHIEALKPSLPADLRVLAEAGGTISLHDGWFINSGWKVGATGVLVIDIACWDQMNASLVGDVWDTPLLHVRLAYQGAELLEPTAYEWNEVVRNRDTEILYGEVDRSTDGGFEHRLLLWPPRQGSAVVRFTSVDLAIVRFLDGRAESVDPTQL